MASFTSQKQRNISYPKLAVHILVLVLAFLLFDLWYQYNIKETGYQVISFIKYNKVYLITTGEKYNYWNDINQGAADMAAISGITYRWSVPNDRSADSQIEKINEAIEDGANALLIAADNPKRISSAIEDAKARGVKIIYVDAPANEEAIVTLSTDNYQSGIIAGNNMLLELEKQGIKSGSIGVITTEKKPNVALRDVGFRKAIQSDGRFHLIDTVVTSGENEAARIASQKLIMENEDLVGLLGTNEGTSEGVGLAIQKDNNRIIGVGFDASSENIRLLKDGSLKVVISQNPYTMGYLGMSEAIAAILGKNTGPNYIDTGISVLKTSDYDNT